ncbi:hypothetical protein [Sphingomonas oligophenolica]|uniref:Uncharacterized protein n=1 Tax=Sphingomonas oligophenolica TaxID=301154 RepID=A0A502CND5_9SPHN|nr:hypothetical protein [Sphingomonas oligophenolica]TPG14368.1 hypothetical protein EAH84_03405 [Sphingomonas oligophenolica]
MTLLRRPLLGRAERVARVASLNTSGLPVLVQFYTATGDILVPDSYDVARVSAWSAGHPAVDGGDGNIYGGGGGGFASSIIAVAAGETLTGTIATGVSQQGATVARAGTTLLKAAGAAYTSGGGINNASIGTITRKGGNGTINTGYYVVSGGGAAGRSGDGGNATSNTTPGIAGTGAAFVRTSDGAAASAGAGGYQAPGGSYGGGGGGSPGGQLYAGGAGLIVIEWGVSDIND